MKNQRGFTLIEVFLIIAACGIIAVLVTAGAHYFETTAAEEKFARFEHHFGISPSEFGATAYQLVPPEVDAVDRQHRFLVQARINVRLQEICSFPFDFGPSPDEPLTDPQEIERAIKEVRRVRQERDTAREQCSDASATALEFGFLAISPDASSPQ